MNGKNLPHLSVVGMKISLVAALLLMIGCASVNLGPRVKDNTVFVNYNNPGRVAENKKAPVGKITGDTEKAKVKDISGKEAEIDLGGWYVMPKDHWNRLRTQLASIPGVTLTDPKEVWEVKEGKFDLFFEGTSSPQKKDISGFVAIPPEVWDSLKELIENNHK